MPSEILSSEHLEDLEPPRGRSGLAPGDRLGRYELLAPIASGRMATVWAARLVGGRGFSKLVAVKTILPELAREPLFEQMFLDEARIASAIHHPNVCDIYEFGDDNRHLYLAMEWVSGDSLAHVLDGARAAAPATMRILARIIADACAGLSAAHDLTDHDGVELGIVHRDISAQNLLVSENGTVKLADFGVAKALNGSDATTSGFLKGKLAYTAPENIETGRADRRTDVFSMGVVLYEATLGCLPFTGDRDAAVMAAILEGKPARPRDVDATYPRELEAIVLRAIARDPEERFPTAEAFGRSLEEWLAKSGPPIMQSAITKLVMSRIGPRIEERKAELRETMRVLDEPPLPSFTFPEPSSPAPPSAPRSEPMLVAQPPPSAVMQVPAAAAFSSFPPAPIVFESRRPPPKNEHKRPLILVAVAFSMCAALGIIGQHVLRRAPHGQGAAPSELRASPVVEEIIELPDDPAPAVAAATAAVPVQDAAVVDLIPTIAASALQNMPAAPPAPAFQATVPPNPY